LGAIRSEEGRWEYKLKVSEQAVKTSNPGIQQVRRFELDGQFVGDGIYDTITGAPEEFSVVGVGDPMGRTVFEPGMVFEDLLVPIYRAGCLVYSLPGLAEIRQRTKNQLGKLNAGVKRLTQPEVYVVGLESGLQEAKARLVRLARGEEDGL
jgi:nicotinate phosphoribosyltransferase